MTNIFITEAKKKVRFDALKSFLNTGEVTEKVFCPSTGPCAWIPLLAGDEKHWARGKSARTLAFCWEDCHAFPPEVEAILRQSNSFDQIEPLLIFPEWQVPLGGIGFPSYNDLWILARTKHGLVSIAIEGKVDEPFDHPLSEWYDESPNKKTRLEYLMSCLALTSTPPGHIYYQLIHRTASAVIMAEEVGAKAAITLVHSFSPTKEWFPEYCEFSRLFGIDDESDKLGMARARNGLPLHLGWVSGCQRYLSA